MTQIPAPVELSIAEYEALRAAITTRGHLRVALVVAGLLGWAACLLVVVGVVQNPALALVPLTVLLGTFEAVRSLHAGVERIGRYVLVFFEEGAGSAAPVPPAPPAWEHAVAQVGGSLPGAAGHPLFSPVFGLAVVVNLAAVVLPGPVPAEWIPLGLCHALFVGWMLYVDRGVRTQRAHDEAAFRAYKSRR